MHPDESVDSHCANDVMSPESADASSGINKSTSKTCKEIMASDKRVKKKVDPRHVRDLLLHGTYPANSEGKYRRSIRRTAERNYRLTNGEFWYRKCALNDLKNPSAAPDDNYHWRRVVFEEHQMTAIMRALHVTESGFHLSRKATHLKVDERFYWPDLCHDVTHFVGACKTCHPHGTLPPFRKEKLEEIPDEPMDTPKKSEINTPSGDEYVCSMCTFCTRSRRQYVSHMFTFHVWRCKCGYKAKNGDLAALHLTKCKESTVHTKVTKALRNMSRGGEKAGGRRSQEAGCGTCAGCIRMRDCGKCKNCMKRKTFGKRASAKPCVKRKCLKIRQMWKKIGSGQGGESRTERLYQKRMARDALDIVSLMDSMDTSGDQAMEGSPPSPVVDQDLFLDAALIDSLASQLVDQYQSEFTSRDPIEEAAEQLDKLEEREASESSALLVNESGRSFNGQLRVNKESRENKSKSNVVAISCVQNQNDVHSNQITSHALPHFSHPPSEIPSNILPPEQHRQSIHQSQLPPFQPLNGSHASSCNPTNLTRPVENSTNNPANGFEGGALNSPNTATVNGHAAALASGSTSNVTTGSHDFSINGPMNDHVTAPRNGPVSDPGSSAVNGPMKPFMSGTTNGPAYCGETNNNPPKSAVPGLSSGPDGKEGGACAVPGLSSGPDGKEGGACAVPGMSSGPDGNEGGACCVACASGVRFTPGEVSRLKLLATRKAGLAELEAWFNSLL